jgi:hypothetical protein
MEKYKKQNKEFIYMLEIWKKMRRWEEFKTKTLKDRYTNGKLMKNNIHTEIWKVVNVDRKKEVQIVMQNTTREVDK